jgi:uncharacterized protein
MNFRTMCLMTPVNNLSIPFSPMRYFTLLLLYVLIPGSIGAQEFPEPMVPLRLVNDYTSLLTEQQQIDLNNKLLVFNNETSTQIYVITYDDLQGFDIADYGARLGEKWGIGQQGKDNGILILVSPANRKITIQTGYGLEGVVTDALSRRLIESVITPGFRTGNYYASLDSATSVLMSLTRGEFKADDYLKKSDEKIPAFLIILFILFIFVFIGISKTRRRFYSPAHTIPWWMLAAGGSGNSGWGSFSSGGGTFGGGGGGFGGGGGGSFGGGGASGGW